MKNEEVKKKKNRKEIPEKVVNLLWARSAGRCQYEGCNEILSRDILTKRNYNAAYIAHIIAAEPDGPRGDIILSPKHCQDFENLMLMCDKHHRLIDRIDVYGHSVDRLVAMKRRHEELIERLTNFKNKTESEILLFGAASVLVISVCAFENTGIVKQRKRIKIVDGKIELLYVL